MSIYIAIPEPTSSDTEYNRRSLPPYLAALHSAGLKATVVPLHEHPDRIARLLQAVHGILLPGSGFDVDPQRYGETPIPECGPADSPRTAVDELLLQDAFNLQKPILAICHGMQNLNVWRKGTLIQDVKTAVNHRPGREVVKAHPVRIAPRSRLSQLIPPGDLPDPDVNSSHHQAIRTPGDRLGVVAVSPADGVIEGVELESDSHFVVGVQWHPERTYTQSAFSRAIFASFAAAVAARESRSGEQALTGAR
jgi:putative glutamine amidotransferase